jgi:hypothetical protein
MTARAGRTYTLLLGIGVAGFLIWLATRVGAETTWRYWAVLGILAGGGLAFALTQRTAYGAWSEVTPLGFVLAFVVALVCVGWIAFVGQPGPNWFRDHFTSWCDDIGILAFVQDMTRYVDVMAFGFGALLASAPGAFGRPGPAPVGAAAVEAPAPDARTRATPPNGDGARTVVRERERTGV